MSNARNIVICTPELLELILSGLPMRGLLVTAPLVSKTWQALTLYSHPGLTAHPLFRPDLSPEPAINPLLVMLFPLFFAAEKLRRWSWPDAEAIQSMPWAKAPEVFKRREASWRRMLVIQPPAPEMIVTEHCHARHGDFERSGVLDDPCLRMGVLYDLVLPFIDRVASGFCIRWPSENTVDELSLVVTYTKQCCGREYEMDRRFYSDANQTVDIQFGERSKVERH